MIVATKLQLGQQDKMRLPNVPRTVADTLDGEILYAMAVDGVTYVRTATGWYRWTRIYRDMDR